MAAFALFISPTTPALHIPRIHSPYTLFYLFNMPYSNSFDINEFINVDMFEDDVPEMDTDTTEASQAVSSIQVAVLLPAPALMCSLA